MKRTVLVGLLCLLGITARGGLIFFDGTFADANWTTAKFFDTTAPGESDFSVTQVSTGGDPGFFRQTNQLYGHGMIALSHRNSAALYDPAASGAILSIDYAYEFIKIFPTGSSGAINYTLALFQSGILYGLNPDEAPNDQTWTTHSHLGLTSLDFSDLSAANPNDGHSLPFGSVHPDFSATGAPILFGYITGNDNPGAPASSSSGIDNWTVTVNSVPEPTTALFGLALMGFCATARRRTNLSASQNTANASASGHFVTPNCYPRGSEFGPFGAQ